MSIIYSGTTIDTIIYSGTTLDNVYYGSTLVYTRDTNYYFYNSGTISNCTLTYTEASAVSQATYTTTPTLSCTNIYPNSRTSGANVTISITPTSEMSTGHYVYINGTLGESDASTNDGAFGLTLSALNTTSKSYQTVASRGYWAGLNTFTLPTYRGNSVSFSKLMLSFSCASSSSALYNHAQIYSISKIYYA